MAHNLSVVILTHNEEANILDCIETVNFADEVIVVDDKSSDRTLELVSGLGNKKIKVFQRELSHNFAAQRNFGIDKATKEWVMFVDADERVSSELKDEVLNNLSTDKSGFYIKRIDTMWGVKLLHGETGNIKLLRIAKKGKGNWYGKVHETWKVDSNVGLLNNALLHFPHPTISIFLKEINHYSTIRADELSGLNTKVNLLDIVLYPKVKFILNYVLKLGFLDGTAGLVFALMMSYHSYLVRSKLWQKNKK